jgi:succinate dehydrogenase / fumarate reductase iron-sulfur subunit
METQWTVTFQVYRQKGQNLPHYDEFKLDVSPDEYVLDGVERIWAFHDRSLTFSHACHHSTCGACGMRVNGLEKLTCITQIKSVTTNGGTIRVEPLRNFPVISDLAVDMGTLYTRMDQVRHRSVLPVEQEVLPGQKYREESAEGDYYRLSDCIECGLCISACPIALTTPSYLGPAVLAGAQQSGKTLEKSVLKLVDSADGVWRCHSAYECTAVCPSHVEPAWRIMDLRKRVVGSKFKGLFGSK